MRLPTASTMPSTSRGGNSTPVTPSCRISDGPPVLVAAMAMPARIPSRITIPNGSYRLGTTRMSQLR